MTLAELAGRTGMRQAFLTAIEDDREEPSTRALGRLLDQLEPGGTSHERIARLLAAPEFDAAATRAEDEVSESLQESQVASDELQFDRVITGAASSTPPSTLAVICAACRTSIETEYYDVNGDMFCGRCRTVMESAAEPSVGIVPLLVAGVFGLGAGIVGAIIYYAVIAIANLEIGIIAILIGYMVGYAVRKGARGRGGLRFQVLAVALTYASVALAYTPIAFKSIDARRQAQKASATNSSSDAREGTAATSAAIARPSGGDLLLAAAGLSVFIAALPVLVVVGSFPSGLISAFIIFLGMRQAWKMTGAPRFRILGPYRVGAAAVSTPV